MNDRCFFTVAAQRCCPVVIAIAHLLYFHPEKMTEYEWEELDLKMKELNDSYEAIKHWHQNATSGAPPAESLSEPDTKA